MTSNSKKEILCDGTVSAYRKKHKSRERYLEEARFDAPRGEAIGASRLTEEKVRLIRSNPENKTMRQLALDFGVHRRTIEKVIYLETWSHVE